jgi:hypothetical protein
VETGARGADLTHAGDGATRPQTAEEARRVRHWRAFLVYLFSEHFWLTPEYEVRAVRYRDWSRATGISENTLHSWYERGSIPNSESVMKLARLCDVLPQAILYHAGRLSLDDLAVYIGPQSLRLLDDEEYEQEVAANEAYQRDDATRASWRAYLDRSLAHTRDLKTRLQLAPEEWAELREELNSPAGQERLREELTGRRPAAAREEDTASAPRRGYYLPAEFTGGSAQAFALPTQRTRRPSGRERVASRPRGGRPHMQR